MKQLIELIKSKPISFIIIVLGTRGLYRIAFNVGGQVEDSTRLEAKGLGGF